ncbi:MAG TPA: hypothetical protein VFB34_12220 [Chloroflexota bacterium]|nr:hypothetical protein [Chloroflexota bacterium]
MLVGKLPPEQERWFEEKRVLNEDLKRVTSYCNDKMSESTGAQLSEPWDTPVRIVAYFTENLAAHLEAIGALVDHPESVTVERSVCSRVEQEDMARSVAELTGLPQFRLGRRADGGIAVLLEKRDKALAKALNKRFGKAVHLTEHGVARVAGRSG